MTTQELLTFGSTAKLYLHEACGAKKKKMTPMAGKQDQTKQDANNQGKDAQTNNRQDNRTQGGK